MSARKPLTRLAIVLVSGIVSLALVEGVYRLVRTEGRPAIQRYFRNAEREPFFPEEASFEERIAFHAGIQKFVEAKTPRPNTPTWLPGAHFYMCYTGPRQPYFDELGCVEYRINSLGLRDREDLKVEKPAGTYRVLCIGDSFTFGWGVRREHNWPVLAEQELRRSWPQIRLVNCGAAGTAYADEYSYGLRYRFGSLSPDLVLVTFCLNDLLPVNGKLCHYREEALPDALRPETPWWHASKVLADLARGLRPENGLDLDPGRDYVQELLSLPPDHDYYRGEAAEAFWAAGTPQRSLQEMQAWCAEHGSRLAVAVWPLLQGLGEGEFYPFTRMHELVSSFCAEQGIPCLDLLPAFRGHPAEDLWVSPADKHPNERAQLLAAPGVAAFLAAVAELPPRDR